MALKFLCKHKFLNNLKIRGNMKQIIIINGKKRAGKDYIANILKEKLGNCEIMHYADALKQIISETFEISLEELDNYKNENVEIIFNNRKTTFRRILQCFATEAIKPVFGNNIWKRIVLEKIKETNAEYIIIPDFRFPEEYIEGSLTVKVLGGDSNDTHISEIALNDFKFDYIIDNTKKGDLTHCINGLLELIK